MSAIFTVVIPTFNSTNYILDTIQSISLATTIKDYEVILVDDCSDDIKTLIDLVKPIKHITLVQKESKTNAADSRNIGYLKANSRFVFFLDSDDHYLPRSIDKRIEFHTKNHAGMVFGNFIANSGNSMKESQLLPYSSEDIREYILFKGADIRSSVISIDKKYFKGTLFDENSYKHQDWIFGIRCWKNDEKILFDNHYLTQINLNREDRMSRSFNLSASEYFCKEYLQQTKYINKLSKSNWKSVVFANNNDARNFFIHIYKPTNYREYYEFISMKLLSNKITLPVSNKLALLARYTLHKYRIFKSV